ncbi:MAG TPA: AglZ/HisF2 family acetamidino modification protein [Flavobacteriales bacterium]|nr:AglZ/HisF2 family acetamidino modification protein [Flavobacteriales bacterium]HPH80999.1 AglZ/HisF2 family acetamidino modification protein [Flavobacteriales bacterium]
MYQSRVIPVLLCNLEGSLVKTQKFKKPVYVGDPVNAVRIFNDKEVDELIFLDITATAQGRRPNFKYISEIATEAFMPLCYGGGLSNLEDIRAVIKAGIEKVAINSALEKDPDLITRTADVLGSSSTVAAIDVKKDIWGKYRVAVRNASKTLNIPLIEFAQMLEQKGAGELVLNSVDRDGMMEGFDLKTISEVAHAVSIPVIASGGAGNLQHLKQAIQAGASAVAAGSMFVFQGKHRAVLISYPSPSELREINEL